MRYQTLRVPASLLIAASTLLAPCLAQAHHAEFMRDKPVLQGLSMPIHGLDHMLVTIAVGALAVPPGRRALWQIPLVFSLCVLLGGILNVLGIPVPLLEHAILASVVVLGVLLLGQARVPALLTVAVLGLFAALQGKALLVSDGFVTSLPPFVLGCLVGTWALLGAGIVLGHCLQRVPHFPGYRYAGWAMLVAAGVIGFFPGANDFIVHLLEGTPH